MASASIPRRRRRTSATSCGFATLLRYSITTSVRVFFPNVRLSMHRSGVFSFRRMRVVLTLTLSVKPSFGPRTTFSVFGSSTPRPSHFSASSKSASDEPSRSRTVWPPARASAAASREATLCTAFAAVSRLSCTQARSGMKAASWFCRLPAPYMRGCSTETLTASVSVRPFTYNAAALA